MSDPSSFLMPNHDLELLFFESYDNHTMIMVTFVLAYQFKNKVKI